MPLHLTRIAFQCDSAADLERRLAQRSAEGEARLTTRYAPKRMEELAGGSLFWILGGLLIGRSPLIGFEDNGAGRYWMKIESRLILAVPSPKRAHQGWRYLEDKDAPRDLGADEIAGDALPATLAAELGRLGLA